MINTWYIIFRYVWQTIWTKLRMVHQQVVASTWARDSHDLFDFEASQLQTFLAEVVRDHVQCHPERLCIVAPSWLIKEVLHCPEFGQVCSLWYRCCALRFVIHVRVVHLAKTKCFGFRGPDAHRHWTSTSRHCIRSWQSFKAGANVQKNSVLEKLWIFWLKLTYCFPSFPVMFSHSQVANQCFAWFSERDATGWTRCGLLRAGSMAMLKFSCCLTNV